MYFTHKIKNIVTNYHYNSYVINPGSDNKKKL